MASMTYQDLYTLVYKEILKNTSYPTGKLLGSDALDRNQVVSGVGTTTAQAIIDVANIINLIMELMLHTIPPQIKTGLTVTATTPESNQVMIEAGEGTVGGKIFTLVKDTLLVVPLRDAEAVYYINFGGDGLNISKTPIHGKLTIAKVVVPKPGVTVHIRDDKDLENYPWDAWIVNFKEIKLFGNGKGQFEEDTRQILRNNIGDILADNLIGNIRLSEDLKITNTQGTIELDSKAVKIYDEDSNKMAEFNRYGTFFYDTAGVQVAKFATDSARVGNILITKNTIQSQNFTSNFKGFRITDDGYAEFEDARIRGVLKATVFEKTSVSAVGGQLIVATASVLVEDLAVLDSSMTTEGIVFSTNDIVLMKDGGTEEYLRILSDVSAPIYTIERDLKGTGVNAWNKGTTVVSTGEPGEGYLILDATSDYSPFLDIISRTGPDWDDIEVKVRLGNLAGITDPELGTLSGYGLYSDNVFLKGDLLATSIFTAISGSRIHMDTSTFFAYDDSENLLFQIFMDDVSGAPGQGGGDVGDIYMGDYYAGQGFFWDKSEATMWIRGLLDASDVTIGRLSVSFLSGGIIGESGDPVDIEMDSNSGWRSSNYPYSGATWGWYFLGDGSLQMTLGGQSGIAQSYIESEDFSASTGWKFTADNTGGDGDIYITMGSTSYITSTDYVADTSGWKLFPSGTSGIEINDGAIQGSLLRDGTVSVDKLSTGQAKRVFVWYQDDELEVLDEIAGKFIVPWPSGCIITKAQATVKDAPTGSNLEINIAINGVDLWAFGSTLDIDSGNTSGVQTTFPSGSVSLSQDDELTLNIEAVGAVIAGTNLLVQLEVDLN